MDETSVRNLLAPLPLDGESSDAMTGNQMRDDLRRWLSAPDPSTNHNIACSTQYQGTAAWFFEGNTFEEWKSTGPLLYISS
jgi:hypothetical protein